MLPILFRFHDAALQTYIVLLSIAFFVGLGVWILEARRFHISAEKVINLALGSFVSGMVGARLLFIFTQLPKFIDGEFTLWALWEGGIVYLGGLIFGFAFLYRAFPRQQISRRVGFDTIAPALAFAHAVGRLGCFANGCCYGRICRLPWAVVYKNPLAVARPLDTPLHPSQLYESFALFILGYVLVRLNRRRNPGKNFATFRVYLAAYAIMRFLNEFTRGDEIRGHWLFFSTSQWLSFLLLFAAIYLDFASYRGDNSPHESRS